MSLPTPIISTSWSVFPVTDRDGVNYYRTMQTIIVRFRRPKPAPYNMRIKK